MVTFTVTTSGSRYNFANGTPVSSERLPDGSTRHVLEDGRSLRVYDEAEFTIEYASTWVGAQPGDTYPVRASLIGLSQVQGFLEVWNHDISEVRSYAFHKIARITMHKSGDVYSSEQVCSHLGGHMLQP